jgi:hypothetical protein
LETRRREKSVFVIMLKNGSRLALTISIFSMKNLSHGISSLLWTVRIKSNGLVVRSDWIGLGLVRLG